MRLGIVATLLVIAGCSAHEESARPRAANTTPSAPPNTVMLDYRESAPEPAPEMASEPESHPRIRQTITLGKNNPDQAYEQEGAPQGGEGPPPQAPAYDGPRSYGVYGGGYIRSGRSGGSRGGSNYSSNNGSSYSVSPSAGTPRVGGDWPAPRSYGPAPVRTRTTP